MKIKLPILITAFLVLGCNSSSNKKEQNLKVKLDSLEYANNKLILESGENVSKAYIILSDSSFSLTADMKKDHRFYGFEKPDLNSKKLILFSIFTSDVDGNPFDLPLGAYYDTDFVDEMSLKYTGEENGFTKVTDVESNKTIYFERKWIIFDDEITDYDDDSIREYGLIEKVEDSGYPIYIVTVNFVERKFKIDFNLNIESIPMDSAELENMKGSYAIIDYTSDIENQIVDIYYNHSSLQGKYSPEKDESWDKFTGILSGAESLSGDLPSKISVTNSLGDKMNFDYFVNEKVQKVNGKEVSVYYYSRAVNTIVMLTPSTD